MAPEDPTGARFYQWMFYMASTVHPFGKNYNYAHRYSTNAAHIPAIKAKALENLADTYGRLEEALEPGPYVLGDRYSAADINSWWPPSGGTWPTRSSVRRLSNGPSCGASTTASASGRPSRPCSRSTA
jgi:glutathione S-transferase